MARYKFTSEGIAGFTCAILDDISDGDYKPIRIRYGNEEIRIPLYPETFEALEELLNIALEVENE